MTVRLPSPGHDEGVWGDILNQYLQVSHQADGSLLGTAVQQAGAVTSVNGKTPTNGNVTLTASDVSAVTSVNGKTPAGGAVTLTASDVSALPAGAVLANIADVSGAASATNGQLLSYDAGTSQWVPTDAPAVAITPRSVQNYMIYVSGGTTYARNGSTGADDYSGTDSAAVLQSVITALGAGGGTVAFQAGTYTWQSIPGLPANLNSWLRLIAEPGAKINLSATGGTRFLDFAKLADGDTFRYLHIEGFTVDAAALASTGGTQHIVVGTYRGVNGTLSGQNVNFDRIVIRRIRTLNVRTAVAATADHLNVWFGLFQNASGLSQNTCTRVLVEQCDFNGGNYGVGFFGGKNGSWTGEPNIYFDQITVRDIYHNTGTVPSQSSTHAHVQVGGRGTGGAVWIERIWGYGSWDVGIEVDGMQHAHITDCYIENCFGFALAITNYQAPTNWHSQAYQIARCTLVRSAGSWSSASSLIGIVPSNNTAGVQQPFGRVIARDVKVYNNVTGGHDLNGGIVDGDLLLLKFSPLEVMIDGGTYYAENLGNTASTTVGPTVIHTEGTSKTKLTLRNIDIKFYGSATAGSAAMSMTALYLAGTLDLLVDNVSVDLNFPNSGANSLRGALIGAVTGSSIHGTIRGFRMLGNTDTGGRGIIVNTSTKLTIPNQLLITDCDFSGMTTGAEILYLDTVNKAKTWVNSIKWITFPKAAYNITAPASGTAAQYTDTWNGTMIITGANVTKVEISRDGTNFYQVSAAGLMAVPMLHTDWYRITYTVAPTVTILPQA